MLDIGFCNYLLFMDAIAAFSFLIEFLPATSIYCDDF